MNHLEELKKNKDIFLKFMSERYKIFIHSNIFLRDIQFAIKFYFERKNVFLKYPQAEELAKEFTAYLVEQNELVQLNDYTWKVLFSIEQPAEEKEEEPKPETEEV
ncbi:hypothetical protein MNBD_IGNAVI01-3009 [hydrothermal vent metagenome]|uniref:Uncharacterized protein n=1 Tax=hydrothermal vent metagenome TaxID=652676 RepID=A0A3B1D3K5_9ZZZZ